MDRRFLRLVLAGLTPGVSLASASVTIGTTTYTLSIATTAAGDPVINIPKSILAGLGYTQFVKINVQFTNPLNALFTYNPKVFSDPFDN